jgi:hypothetical protein
MIPYPVLAHDDLPQFCVILFFLLNAFFIPMFANNHLFRMSKYTFPFPPELQARHAAANLEASLFRGLVSKMNMLTFHYN